ncbi:MULTISPECIES: hypothetical protein [Hydrocarboniphaga]|uniref:DUF2399 domain-containing protein n=1 Tax=Hydrocarboniphaga effusa AP103 TaxID=1172194 RepID=I8TBU3_9GAMM|nr:MULTISPECIES: hypothetical protein [Hydrocarboniphaga]EIT71360.1 hypothetical protein WQQ_14970 [Hydrocarboniphaga effusa AP103]MDZ4077651.1 hypothetical protein [Hydrocarboniphaga sp.]
MSEADWSSADARGIRTRAIDVGAKSTLRGKRQRRVDALDPEACAAWPEDWRTLAREWLADSASRQWKTLLGIAGPTRAAMAPELLDALLVAGWLTLDEKREDGRWVAVRAEFRELERLRERLGLPNRDRLAERHRGLLDRRFDDAALDAAAQALIETAPALAIRRHSLLGKLADWSADRRSGTRRDFALFAAGDTKGIADADWNWLAASLSLAEFGIEAHTPLLLMRAPLAIAAVPDFIGLTPETIAAGIGSPARIPRWRLVENRTSFERAARRYGAEDGVIWLPGYPPGWWMKAVAQLLEQHPAPALIACDPDPAGIEIALSAAAPWESAGLDWQPWQMEPAVLNRLPTAKPLAEADRVLLSRLLGRPLPTTLRALAEAMRERGIKGEQEGLGEL